MKIDGKVIEIGTLESGNGDGYVIRTYFGSKEYLVEIVGIPRDFIKNNNFLFDFVRLTIELSPAKDVNHPLCWWFGCEKHEQDPSPPEYAECIRCGGIVSYEDMTGMTRWNLVKDWLIYWMFRKWFPKACTDCGKRYSDHDNCLPF